MYEKDCLYDAASTMRTASSQFVWVWFHVRL